MPQCHLLCQRYLVVRFVIHGVCPKAQCVPALLQRCPQKHPSPSLSLSPRRDPTMTTGNTLQMPPISPLACTLKCCKQFDPDDLRKNKTKQTYLLLQYWGFAICVHCEMIPITEFLQTFIVQYSIIYQSPWWIFTLLGLKEILSILTNISPSLLYFPLLTICIS